MARPTSLVLINAPYCRAYSMRLVEINLSQSKHLINHFDYYSLTCV